MKVKSIYQEHYKPSSLGGTSKLNGNWKIGNTVKAATYDTMDEVKYNYATTQIDPNLIEHHEYSPHATVEYIDEQDLQEAEAEQDIKELQLAAIKYIIEEKLNPKEKQIINLLLEGKSWQQIGVELNQSAAYVYTSFHGCVNTKYKGITHGGIANKLKKYLKLAVMAQDLTRIV